MSHTIQVHCLKSNLHTIRSFVREQLVEERVAKRLADLIVVAVDEACVNAMQHSHQFNDQDKIEIGVECYENRVEISLLDTGNAFPINQFQPLPLEERIRLHCKGGMGILLINQIMDDISVEQFPEYHIFRFVKYL